MTKLPEGDQLAKALTKFTRPGNARLEWALVGFVIWLISLDTCLVFITTAEPISVDLRSVVHAWHTMFRARPQG